MNLYDLQDKLRSKIRLTGWAVGTMAISVFFLESVEILDLEKIWKDTAIISVVGSFAFMRLALFLLGSTLELQKSRNKAFYSAILFTLLFVGYFWLTWWYDNDFLPVPKLALISIGALALLPAEWILGETVQQMEATKVEIKRENAERKAIEDKKIEERKRLNDKNVKRIGELEKEKKALEELVAEKNSQGVEFQLLTEEKANLLEKIEALESAPNHMDLLTKSNVKILVQEGDTNKTLRVCPKCGGTQEQASNRQTKMICENRPQGIPCEHVFFDKTDAIKAEIEKRKLLKEATEAATANGQGYAKIEK